MDPKYDAKDALIENEIPLVHKPEKILTSYQKEMLETNLSELRKVVRIENKKIQKLNQKTNQNVELIYLTPYKEE